VKACPKCSYVRTAADAKVPDWQCPKCGIAYAKFEAQQLANWETKRPAAPATPAVRGSSAALNMAIWAVAVVAFLAFLAYSGIFRAMHEAQGDRTAMSAPGGGPPPEALVMSEEALSGLAQITPSKVVLFSTAWCPYCAKVKALLQKQGVRYTELDVERDTRNAEFQRQYMVVRGFPVLIVGSRIVPGYDEGAILAALKTL
jgi:glutaredoxin